jgi:Na+/Pi-cotransporter
MATEPAGRATRRKRLRHLGAWLLTVLVLATYLALPEGEAAPERGDDVDDESERLEIRAVSPLEPYPGSTLIIRHNGRGASDALHAFAGRSELAVLARRPGELVAKLPAQLEPGALKIRLSSADVGKPYQLRALRTKPFLVRVKSANWRKVFRSLVGGIALVALGIGLMAQGVRASTDPTVARAITRASSRRTLAYGFGVLSGAFAQSTTGAAGLLAALASSQLLPLAPAALAFLGAQLGATLAPLLVTGLVEPREGLLAVTVGVVWLGLASDRRAGALARLVVGAGFVAFGLQTLRPALEPFLSDPVFLSLSEHLRADDVMGLTTCAALGTLLVALLQGPAPLVVLVLGVAQTMGQWDLSTALALLSGTGLGAALAALITSSSGPIPSALARVNLVLGALSSVLAAATVPLFAWLAQVVLGPYGAVLHWTRRVPLAELGWELALGFLLTQLMVALVLSALLPVLQRRLRAQPPPEQAGHISVRDALAHVLSLQQGALDHVAVLAQTGARGFGQRAEATLADARIELEALLDRGPAAFCCLQLQNALEMLLARAESATDAGLSEAAEPGERAAWSDQPLLRELHALVSEGLAATSRSVREGEFEDLDRARAREIEINRLEARARSQLSQPEQLPPRVGRALRTLQVVDAYEAVGNQIYRLSDVLDQSFRLPSLS